MAEDNSTPRSDAVAALISLGYKLPEAERLITKVDAPGMSTEQMIRAVLKRG